MKATTSQKTRVGEQWPFSGQFRGEHLWDDHL